MMLQVLPHAFTVCRVDGPDSSGALLSEMLAPGGEFCFIGKTDEELSVVCPTSYVPPGTVARADGWRAFRIVGVLDFSLVGILAAISGALAAAEIGIFAVSTFNTDYVLVKEEQLSRALEVLAAAGYTISDKV